MSSPRPVLTLPFDTDLHDATAATPLATVHYTGLATTLQFVVWVHGQGHWGHADGGVEGERTRASRVRCQGHRG